VLFADDDLYVMQRQGIDNQGGLAFVLDNRGDWTGTWVQTRWNNTRLVPAAWRGRDELGTPQVKWTNESGWTALWAPPRGYAVYVPE
jgi:alpha-amylase